MSLFRDLISDIKSISVITPKDAAGASLLLHSIIPLSKAKHAFEENRIVADFRGDNLLRITFVGLYNTPEEVRLVARLLKATLTASSRL